MSAVGQANPFSDASEFNTLDFIIARATDEMQTVSIGEVIAVNTGAQTVDVQILVNLVTGANTPVEHEVIAGRPYFRLQGGGNAIICDPVVGDIGIVVFASRDITGVVAAKGAANPSSNRRFSWSDGIYFGGILNGAPTQYMQFLAGGGGINIVSPGTVAIQAPATTNSGTLNVVGNTTLQATLAVTGASTLTGAVTASGGITTTTIAAASAVFSGSVTASSFIGGGGGGGGTVTSVATGTGLVGGPITTSGTISLSSTTIAALALATTALQSISIATGTGLTGGPLGASGSTVALSAATIASLLPGSPVQGDLAYYNGSAWALLAPSTAGFILQTNGAGANPTWVANGGGSTPVPATIPDLVCWFAFDNINSAAGKVQTGLFDRTPWRTGAAAAQISSSVAISSTQLNGLNTITWPSGNVFPLTPSFSMAGGGTYFIVINGASNSGNQAITGGSTGSLSLYLQTSGAANHIGLVNGSTAILTASTAAWVVGTWFQANVTYLASTGAFAYRQGRAAANSGTTSTFTVTPSSFFGSDNGASPLNGASVAEFIAYNRVLSGTEITNVENYLNTKWGV